jgi:Zn finger protein HypA/HybF involved in hydrogenase expression
MVEEKVEGYCVKCKAKREIAEAKETTIKGKGGKTRRAMKGKCPKCGTTMFRIMPNK